jgi:hypothetical protein
MSFAWGTAHPTAIPTPIEAKQDHPTPSRGQFAFLVFVILSVTPMPEIKSSCLTSQLRQCFSETPSERLNLRWHVLLQPCGCWWCEGTLSPAAKIKCHNIILQQELIIVIFLSSRQLENPPWCVGSGFVGDLSASCICCPAPSLGSAASGDSLCPISLGHPDIGLCGACHSLKGSLPLPTAHLANSRVLIDGRA